MNFSNISKAIVRTNRLKFATEAKNVEPLTLKDAIDEGRVDWVQLKLTEADGRGDNMLLNKEIILKKPILEF